MVCGTVQHLYFDGSVLEIFISYRYKNLTMINLLQS